MGNKFIVFLTVISILFGVGVACLFLNLHVHEYSEDFSFNDTHHWHEATCECDKVSEYEEHSFDENGRCTVCSYTSSEEVGELYYKYSLNKDYVTVVGCSPNLKKVEIPESYDGLPVVSISSEAFYNNKNVTEISIPTTLKSIGKSAFIGCLLLNRVFIKDLKAWCEIVFADARANPLFYANKLYLNGEPITQLEIPSDVTKISDFAFIGCITINKLTLPEGITSIGKDSFRSCINLKKTTYENCTYLCANGNPYFLLETFVESPYQVNVHDQTKIIGDFAFESCKTLKIINFSNNLISIGKGAFYNCHELTQFNLQNGIKYLGEQAFANCASLQTVFLPETLTFIGYEGFANCNELVEITIPFTGEKSDGSGETKFGHLFGAAESYIAYNSKVPVKLTTVTINGCYGIVESAFDSCSNLKQVILGDNVPFINGNAFNECNKLINLTIGASVSLIDPTALIHCNKLKNVNVSDNNEHYVVIDYNLYTKDESVLVRYFNTFIVEEFVIPETVTKIGDYAFYNKKTVEKVIIHKNLNEIGNYAFCYCTELQDISIPNGVTAIGESAFSCNYQLQYVNFSNSISIIPNKAFSWCEQLKTVSIPSNVKEIGDAAFYGCTNLEEINFSEGLQAIGDSAFMSCKKLASVQLPLGLTQIGKEVFSNCELLKTVEMPNTLKNIGNSAFYECVKLEYVYIPSSVEFLGDYAFYGCKALQLAVIREGLKNINPYTFMSCESLEYLRIPSVENIGEHAFRECSILKEVSLDKVKTIGVRAFRSCTSLESVVVGKSLEKVEESAFSGCKNLKKAYYMGDADQWKKISFESSNNNLKGAILLLYSETQPLTDGNFWCFDQSGRIVEW